MVSVSYSTVIDSVQANIYTILNSNSTIKSYAEKIMDGIGSYQERQSGYGRCLIRAPQVSEKRITFNKWIIDVTTEIQCFSRQEGLVRKLADAVREALNNAQYSDVNSTFEWSMSWKNIDSTNIRERELDDGRVEYEIDVIVKYVVISK